MLLVPPVWLLVIGGPVLHAVPLFGLAVLPGLLLKVMEDKRKAVGTARWSLNAYLLCLGLVVPVM